MEDSLREVVPPFQEAMDLINAGQVEEGFAELGNLPEWYGKVHATRGLFGVDRASARTWSMRWSLRWPLAAIVVQVGGSLLLTA